MSVDSSSPVVTAGLNCLGCGKKADRFSSLPSLEYPPSVDEMLGKRESSKSSASSEWSEPAGRLMAVVLFGGTG